MPSRLSILGALASAAGLAWVALLAELLPATTHPLTGLLAMSPGLACVAAGLLLVLTD